MRAAEEVLQQFGGILSHSQFAEVQNAVAAKKLQQQAQQQAQLEVDRNAAAAALRRASSASQLEARGDAVAMHAALETALAEVKRLGMDDSSSEISYAKELLSRGPGALVMRPVCPACKSILALEITRLVLPCLLQRYGAYFRAEGRQYSWTAIATSSATWSST